MSGSTDGKTHQDYSKNTYTGNHKPQKQILKKIACCRNTCFQSVLMSTDHQRNIALCMQNDTLYPDPLTARAYGVASDSWLIIQKCFKNITCTRGRIPQSAWRTSYTLFTVAVQEQGYDRPEGMLRCCSNMFHTDSTDVSPAETNITHHTSHCFARIPLPARAHVHIFTTQRMRGRYTSTTLTWD